MNSTWFYKYTFLVLLAFGFWTTSCSSSDDGPAVEENMIRAKVDGQSFKSVSGLTTATREPSPLGGEVIGIFGKGPDNDGMVMFLFVDGVGTYPFGGDVDFINSVAYTAPSPENPQQNQTWETPDDFLVSGELKITEMNETRIRGMFKAVVTNFEDDSTKEITEGVFSVKF